MILLSSYKLDIYSSDTNLVYNYDVNDEVLMWLLWCYNTHNIIVCYLYHITN